jgi:hypothetical protein
MTRVGIVATIIGLAAYVTGLQKYVLDPIIGGFQDLRPGVQLLILTAIVALVVAGLVLRARGRRSELALAEAAVAAHLVETPPVERAGLTDAS